MKFSVNPSGFSPPAPTLGTQYAFIIINIFDYNYAETSTWLFGFFFFPLSALLIANEGILKKKTAKVTEVVFSCDISMILNNIIIKKNYALHVTTEP